MWKITAILILFAGCAATAPRSYEPTTALLFDRTPGAIQEFGRPDWPTTGRDVRWEGYEHAYGYYNGRIGRRFSYWRSE